MKETHLELHILLSLWTKGTSVPNSHTSYSLLSRCWQEAVLQAPDVWVCEQIKFHLSTIKEESLGLFWHVNLYCNEREKDNFKTSNDSFLNFKGWIALYNVRGKGNSAWSNEITVQEIGEATLRYYNDQFEQGHSVWQRG